MTLSQRFKYHWRFRIGWAGVLSLVVYSLLERLGRQVKSRYFPIRIKGLDGALYARFGSSDGAVFHQIFIEQEYAGLKSVRNPKLIIDCGANVGYSSAWFLNRYPGVHMIAIEPDEGNFAICCRNLKRYDPRVTLVRAAVWPSEVGLKVVRGEFKDGLEWSYQVRECRLGESPDLRGVDIDKLLRASGYDSIDILKIDIEKSEKILFSRHYEHWLPKVKNIAIELHDKECENVFFRALQHIDCNVSRSGELTICENMTPKVFAAQAVC